MIGSIKGEGYFKRATGIAVDSPAQRIYVTDTLRHQIWVLDMQGTLLQKIGAPGSNDGQFNFPTELRLDGQDLLVVDAMNFRVQVLDRSGKFEYAVGQMGNGSGNMFRPKGIGRDSEGHLYVVEGLSGLGAGLRPPRTAALLLRAKGVGVRRISIAHRFVYRSQRPGVCGRLLQSPRSGFSVLRAGQEMITTKTPRRGDRRQETGVRMGLPFSFLLGPDFWLLPCVLVVIFLVSPAPRGRRRHADRCDRHA